MRNIEINLCRQKFWNLDFLGSQQDLWERERSWEWLETDMMDFTSFTNFCAPLAHSFLCLIRTQLHWHVKLGNLTLRQWFICGSPVQWGSDRPTFAHCWGDGRWKKWEEVEEENIMFELKVSLWDCPFDPCFLPNCLGTYLLGSHCPFKNNHWILKVVPTCGNNKRLGVS